jgi:SAM-dependent methyltransferase
MKLQKTSEKYSRETISNPAKIKKGKTRWNQCVEALEKIDPQLLQGPVLDFGCGVGYFVLEGLRRGIDIWGIDQFLGKIKRFQKLLEYTGSPTEWGKHCLTGDGVILPFSTDSFSLVTSWWVYEHISNPGEAIREMVRVTRPGGVIVIRAQDAHTSWEGHCNIPWIPYLPGHLERAWIEEFGKSHELRDGVYNISQSQVSTILDSLGCRTIIQAEPPKVLIENHRHLCTENEVRRAARQVKAKLDNGEWHPVQEGLYIFAQKV